jgi:hypothetical protein
MKTQLLSVVVVLFIGANAPAQSTTALPGYLTAYMQLKDALHQDDPAKSAVAASDMNSKISAEVVSDSKKLESIKTLLVTITASGNIEEQRVAFAKLSQYMITLLENNPISGITLYSDYCHMARDGKGAYWISTDKEINNNPYMGGKMPHCGTIDEKLSK